MIHFCLTLAIALTTLDPAPPAQGRPRVIVLTDYFKDPDDKQSLIRLLTYANEFEIEGLIATSLAYGDGSVRPELIRELIAGYAEVFPSLRKHGRSGYEYPSPESLLNVVKAGAPVVRTFVGASRGFEVPYPVGARDTRRCEPAEKWLGVGKDSAASEHIIRVVERDDPRPVWVIVWGGAMDLAQALWKVRHDYSPEAAARFIAKLRVYQSSWQDTGAVWNWNHVPELFLIQSNGIAPGMYLEGPAEMRDKAWLEENITHGHGHLGEDYPGANAHGKTELTVKEGDSPTYLHLLAAGLSDPEHPEWGGWGGRFRRFDPQRRFFVPDQDDHPASGDPQRRIRWTLARWNEAISNDFAARMDRCVKPYEGANHPPIVHVEGDSSIKVLTRNVTSGQSLSLDATGTHDPDGDSLSFRWGEYSEAGSCRESVRLEDSTSPRARLIAPAVPGPRTIHVILSVTDAGTPHLVSYRRVIVTVSPTRPGSESGTESESYIR